MEECKIVNLYDLRETIASDLLKDYIYPWEVLPHIKDYILKLGPTLDKDIFEEKGKDIWIAKSAKIHSSADITGPCIIDENVEIRPSAFIRGSVIVGKNSTVGNSTEIKNVILFNNVEVPHYNYVGDSVLGFHAHMGAGSITSNIKADRKNVVVKSENETIETGLRKFGAMLGDYAEIGCNTVLNPGSVVGKNTNIYPLSMVRGVVPENSIYKNESKFTICKKRGINDEIFKDARSRE